MREEITGEREVGEFLAACVRAESVSLVAGLGRFDPDVPPTFLLVRAPGWDREGLPGSGGGARASACETQWGTVRDDRDVYAVLRLAWPNGAGRRLLFDLRDSVGNFPEMLVRFAAPASIATFGVTPDRGADFAATFVELDLDDEMLGFLVGLRAHLRDTGELPESS